MSTALTIRVLLVEDDEEDVLIFKRYACNSTSFDLQVDWAPNEAEAWRSITEGQYDMAFLDLNLDTPLAGMDFLERARHHGITTPIVVVTGSGNEAKAVEAMKLGAYDYLVKGKLGSEAIEKSVMGVLQRREAEHERDSAINELAALSVTDELTGLANRRKLTETLDREIRRSTRNGRPFSLMMLDLDHFKAVNDTYGHAVGDQVLRKCAEILQAQLRDTDLVARYGGEEFCMVFPETALKNVLKTAKRIGKAMRAAPKPMPTVSIGAVCWEVGESADETIARADTALYKAKEAGRDRVMAA